MQAPAIPSNEDQRLAELRSLHILDTEAEERFDRITRLAKKLFQVEIALVSLVDADRQWFKSKQGLDAAETPRDISFCGHAIVQEEIFVVEDASLDQRFADNPLVTCAPNIRFYAGYPLKGTQGHFLGTLCIIDSHPRALSGEEYESLADLGALIERELANSTIQNLLIKINERERAATAAIRQSHEELQTIIDHMPAMIGYWDCELKNKFGNRTYGEWFNQRPDEIRGKHIRDVIGNKLYLANKKNIEDALLGHPQLFEREITPVGTSEKRIVIASYVPDFDQDKKVKGFYAFVTDISHIRDVERAQVATQLELERLINSAEDAIISYNTDGIITRWNPAAERIFGYSRHEAEGQSITLITLEEEHEKLIELFQHLVREDQVEKMETTTRNKNGQLIHIASTISPIKDVDGKVVGVSQIVRDVTAQFQLQQSKLENEMRWKFAVEGSGEGVWDWDAETHVTIYSKRWKEMLGYDDYEIGQTNDEWYSRIHPDDREELMAVRQLHFEGATPYFAHEYRLRRKDGSWLWIYDRGMVVRRDAQGKPLRVVGTNSDISERKQAEIDLKAALAKAESASIAKSAFVANMSHEIRTPMNAVLGMANLLSTTALTSQQKKYLEMILSSGKSLLSIINDILDFSKIEAGRMELAPTQFSLEHMMNALAEIMSVNAGEKDLELVIKVNPDVPQMLFGDALRLQQVLVNLIANAIKFTEKGEVSLSVLKVATEGEIAQLQFIVQDSGIGMTQGQVNRLFVAFTQADVTVTRRFGGTGLGLAISKKFIDLMHGQIEVQSEVGKGSTFTLSLPLQIQESSAATPTISPLSATYKLLLIDENPSSRASLASIAQRCGLTVHAVSTLKAARSVIDSTGSMYDSIMVDWRLATQQSETLQALLETQDYAKLIFLASAFGRGQLIDHPLGEKAAAILNKPITLTNLHHVFAEITHPEAASSVATPTVRNEGRQLTGARFLLVEDNLLNQVVARGLLERAGAHVQVVDNGKKAVDLLSQESSQFDLVLMDVQMPVMDGFIATQIIRNELKLTLPVLAMSAGVMESEKAQCLASGMDDFIAKPIDMDQMFVTIQRHLQIRTKKPKELAKQSDAISPSQSPSTSPIQKSEEVSTANDILDTTQLFAMCDGDEECRHTLMDLLRGFVERGQQQLDEAQQAWESGNPETCTRALHGMRGSIGSLGAKQFADIALTLEKTMKADAKADNLALLFAQTQQVMKATIEAAKDVLKQH